MADDFEIDSLAIGIKADAKSAVSAIDSLCGSLDRLVGSLSVLGNSKSLTSLDEISNSLSKLNNVDSTNLSGIGSSLRQIGNGLASINKNNVTLVSANIGQIADSLSKFNNVSLPDGANLSSLADSIRKLGTAGAERASANFPIIADSLVKFTSQLNQISSFNFDTTSFQSLLDQISRFGYKGMQTAATTIPFITAEIQTLVTTLNQVGHLNIDVQQITEFVTSIGKLGGVNIQRAVQIMPAFTRELMSMLTALSNAPQIAQDTIQMTNALANLANTLKGSGAFSTSGSRSGFHTWMNKMSSGIKKFSHNVKNMVVRMKHAEKSTMGLAQAFGKFYATFWLALRAVRGVWNAVESSMEYVEILNYFNASMTQITKQIDLSAWESLGYDSAEAYAKSFYDQATNLFTKLSGYKIGENGMLINAQMTSLGLDPSKVMSAYTQFAQMSNSMGVAAETSLKLAEALTLIGTDLSSIRDIEFEDTWRAITSALTGTARAMDTYGINLRVSGMNQELLNLGIDTTANKLSQADKAILRTITILDSSRFGWTDLINTIDSGANRLRVFQASLSNLARTLGNIFLPIVAAVLPYVTALVNALQRLAEWFVTLLGFDNFEWGGIGGAGDAISDILDAAEGANEEVGKLKDNLQSFDKLNVLKTDSGSGADGIGGSTGLLQAALDKILEEYMAQWNEAYENLENRTQEFADTVQSIFRESGLYGVGRYFADSFENALRGINWEPIWNGAETIGTGLADFLNGIISPSMFESVGETIANAIKTAVVGALAFTTNFDWSNLGESLSKGLSGFARNYPWKEKIHLAGGIGTGFADAINSFFTNLTDDDIENIANVIYSKIASAITFAFNLVTGVKWYETLDKIKNLFRKIIEKMNAKNIDYNGERINTWQMLGITVGNLINGLIELLSSIPWSDVIEGAWDAIQTGFDTVFEKHPVLATIMLELTVASAVFKGTTALAAISKAIGGGATVGKTGSLVGGGMGIILPVTLTEQFISEHKNNKDKFNELYEKLPGTANGYGYGFGANIDLAKEQENANEFQRIWSSAFSFVSGMFLKPIADFSKKTQETVDETEKSSEDTLDVMTSFTSGLVAGVGATFDSLKTNHESVTANMSYGNRAMKDSLIADYIGIEEGATPLFINKMNDYKTNYSSVTANMAESMRRAKDSIVLDMQGLSNDTERINANINRSFIGMIDNVKNCFTGDKWTFQGVTDGLKTTFTNATNTVSTIWSNLMKELNGEFTIEQSANNAIHSYWKPMTFAAGGLPTTGDLFIANESGPEYVASFGNRTGVANNDQIVTGIENGVYRAVSSAMKNGNMSVVLEGDAKGIFKVVRNEANDYFKTYGRSAFTV